MTGVKRLAGALVAATEAKRLGRALVVATALLLLLGLSSGVRPATAVQPVDLHEIRWFVHVDLIDAGAGRDLAWWQSVIDASNETANLLLEGSQGPFDTPCCTRLARSASVSLFGSPGDGRDVVDTEGDQNAIAGLGGPGSKAYLVDSITYCGGSAPAAIGCASQPSCNGNGNDDPSLWMIVTAEAWDDGTLPAVLAHERGHNACLPHVASAECQLMQATVFTPGQAGCLAASECSNFRAGRTTTSSGQECGCHASGGGLEADGSVCSAGDGLCSGGLCGELGSDASVEVLVAADPGLISGGPPDDALRLSGLAGDWSVVGAYSRADGPTQIRGMAYATDSDTLYGVVPTVGDDAIVTIDRATGTVLTTVGTIANGAQEFVSMAYDPGPTAAPGDDRLILLEVDGAFGEFRTIDPASPSTTTLLGTLPWQPAASFTGLAYDSQQDRLFAAAEVGFATGLWEVDLGSCPPSPCTTTEVGTSSYFRESPSLDYSPITGMLYLVGEAFSGQRVFYDVIDPASFESAGSLSLDVFTPAALAVVPEPGLGAALAVGVIVIGVTAGRRRPENPPARA